MQVLIEGPSRRSADVLTGKTCTMKRVMIPNVSVPGCYTGFQHSTAGGHDVMLKAGDYAAVLVHSAGNANLFGEPLARTGICEFVRVHGSTVAIEGCLAHNGHIEDVAGVKEFSLRGSC